MKENIFFDINKLPKKEGILVFGISMSRIGNEQSAKKCFRYMESFIPKVLIPAVGLNMIYADNLYFYSDEKASKLKIKFQALASSHKYEFLKILKKHTEYIPKSFSFSTWSQILLESKEFTDYLGRLQKQYLKDKEFQKYVKEDIKSMGKKPGKQQVNFILEEILVLYLISKGKIRLVNDYVQDKEKWVLNCYPGKPLKSEIYLFQKNIFKLSNPKNTYENSYYDLEEKKLYDFTRVNLKSIKL